MVILVCTRHFRRMPCEVASVRFLASIGALQKYAQSQAPSKDKTAVKPFIKPQI